MYIIQSYYVLSNKNHGPELMFLFNIGLSHLTNKLSLISNKNLTVLRVKIVKSANKGLWLQNKRRSRIELWADGFPFLKVNVELPMFSPDLTFRCLSASP